MRAPLLLLRLAPGHLSLMEQLCLEEALFRGDARSWCVLAHGDPRPAAPPTVVLGVAGELARLVHVPAAAARGATALRRFTGGGTVVVDGGTLFASFVMNKRDAAADAPLFPREVMRWSAGVYAPVFERTFGGGGGAGGGFSLREHDYCWGDRKVGGNAQSVSRDRWVHHTSFLWDFDARNMLLLRMPERRPEYRRDRGHADFLVPMSSLSASASREGFLDALEERLRESFDVRTATLGEALEVTARPEAQERRGNAFVELMH